MSNFSRRDFLKTGALGSLFAGSVAVGCTTGTTSVAGNWKGKAKNVIFMVSDGMSAGTLTMADQMKRRLRGSASNWISLYEQNLVNRGFMDMSSLNAIVTDSAAASSSWGCGHRINNGGVNMSPEGEAYTPILMHFKNVGKKTGLVTTTTMTHATPAGFIANVPNRGMEADIAVQLLERQPDLLLGGGNRFFAADMRDDGRDLYAEFIQKGYHVARTKAELEALQNDGKPVLGIFFDSHLPYTVDHLNVPEYLRDVPTLAEMTGTALRRLSGSEGFILQVEGGKIDHAAHSNDAAGLIFDQIAFDDAVGVAMEFVNANPDTLLIITSDHGNANPALNGFGSGYAAADAMFDSLALATRTNNTILTMLSENDSVARIREVIETYTTHAISIDQAGFLKQAMAGHLQ
ncbi:MAG TPA: alkaline phosphatase [Bacteroidetes bacterium]|nr:alkaline phosphatase [Bacteroidota bacterium]